MDLHEDVIVAISAAREKFFGCSGRMLLPSVATVAAAVRKVPKRKLITTELLRKKLAEQFGVQAVCPVTTQQALQAIANDASNNVAYWRVVKKKGELMASFPGGLKGHAENLRQEGFVVDLTAQKPKVKNLAESLVD